MSIRHMKKIIEIPGSRYFSFFELSNLLTKTCLHFCTTEQLTSSEHAKCTYINTETTLNIEHKQHRHVSKTVDMFFRELVHVYKAHGKKNIEIPVYIFAGQGSALRLNTCKMYIYYYICLPLCAHTLYFDASKFSIKQFSLIFYYITFIYVTF